METVTTDKFCVEDIRHDVKGALPRISLALEGALNKLLQDSAGYPQIAVRWVNEGPDHWLGAFQISVDRN